jgi:tRNA1Val (adenine37-N6)-methyltransferase
LLQGGKSLRGFLKPDETLEDLQRDGLFLIQKKSGFRFGVDAVLLADFARVKEGAKLIDLGTGTGILPVLLSAKTKAKEILGIEIQPDMVDMAKRSVALNKISGRVTIQEGDIKNKTAFPKASYDVVTTNPPYIKLGSGMRTSSEGKDISRHEVLCTLEDVVGLSARILSPGGQFFMVHKPERLVDIVCIMREYKIEPKLLRWVHPKPTEKPNILLIKGCKNGGTELKTMPPLYVFNEDGRYTDEVNRIYGRVNAP